MKMASKIIGMLLISSSAHNVLAFAPPDVAIRKNISCKSNQGLLSPGCSNHLARINLHKKHTIRLNAQGDDELQAAEEDAMESSTLLGITGLIASSTVLYSESVLFNTGCGLPAGPFGLVGAIEGISYLGVVGLVGYSLYTKISTGSGLPAGKGGLLGAAEGVAYLAALAGILVLIAQITNYGYIPNAVPMEGGMCK